MSETDFANYMVQKYSLAIAIAVIRSKPENLSLMEYTDLLRKNVVESQKSVDSLFDDISIHDSDFDDDEMINISDVSETILKDIDQNILVEGDHVANVTDLCENLEENTKKPKVFMKTSTPNNLTQTTLYESLSLKTSITPCVTNDATYCNSFSQESSKTNQYVRETKNKLKTPMINNINDSQETEIYTVHGFTENYTHLSQSQDNIMVEKKLLHTSLNNKTVEKSKEINLNSNQKNYSNSGKRSTDYIELVSKKPKSNTKLNEINCKETSTVNKIVQQSSNNEETIFKNVLLKSNAFLENKAQSLTDICYYQSTNNNSNSKESQSIKCYRQNILDLREISGKKNTEQVEGKQKSTSFENTAAAAKPAEMQVLEQRHNSENETSGVSHTTRTHTHNQPPNINENCGQKLSLNYSKQKQDIKSRQNIGITNAVIETNNDKSIDINNNDILKKRIESVQNQALELFNNNQKETQTLSFSTWTNSEIPFCKTNDEIHVVHNNDTATNALTATNELINNDKNLQSKSNDTTEIATIRSESQNTWANNSCSKNNTRCSKQDDGSLTFSFLNNVNNSNVTPKSVKFNESVNFSYLIQDSNSLRENYLNQTYPKCSLDDSEGSIIKTCPQTNNLRQIRKPKSASDFNLFKEKFTKNDKTGYVNKNCLSHDQVSAEKLDKYVDKNKNINIIAQTNLSNSNQKDFTNFGHSVDETIIDNNSSKINYNQSEHKEIITNNTCQPNIYDLIYQNKAIDILTQTQDVNNSFASENISDESAEAAQIISFKVLEEFNKIKKYLSKKELVGDFSTSNSQSMKSFNASQYSENWINESGYCLLDFMTHSPLVPQTMEITGEISRVFGHFVDKLHEDENYPTFLEKILSTVKTLLTDIYEDQKQEDVAQKYESIERLLLLNRSNNILKYTLDNIVQVLEDIHSNIKDGVTLEIDCLEKCENICFIFHILEILLKRYIKKTRQSQTSTQPSQERLKRSDITEIWRKKWNLSKSEVNEGTFKKKCILTVCSQILNKIIVCAMDGYSLISFSALQCFNLLQK